MTDLEALAGLLKTLREGGVVTYEGPVPHGAPTAVKLTMRPPDPATKVPEQRPTKPPKDKDDEAKPIPAGLYGIPGLT